MTEIPTHTEISEAQKAPSPFSESIPNFQLSWDSTSMTWLQECPRKYYYSMIRSKRSKKPASALSFGIAFHKAMEIYHREKAYGEDHDTATLRSVEYCMGPENRDLWFMEDSARTPFTLTRSVIWYLEQYKDDPAETYILKNGNPALELSFRIELPTPTDENERTFWCGHIDRVVKFLGQNMVTDYKTTAGGIGPWFFRNFDMSNQMSGYLFGATIFLMDEPINQVMIDGIEVKVNFTRFGRDFTQRTEDQLEAWVQNTEYWIHQAREYALADFWPQNLTSCDKYGGCTFRDVCRQSPIMREEWLEADYMNSPWNPLESREK